VLLAESFEPATLPMARLVKSGPAALIVYAQALLRNDRAKIASVTKHHVSRSRGWFVERLSSDSWFKDYSKAMAASLLKGFLALSEEADSASKQSSGMIPSSEGSAPDAISGSSSSSLTRSSSRSGAQGSVSSGPGSASKMSSSSTSKQANTKL